MAPFTLVLVALLTAAYGVVGGFVRPAMYSDSGFGFLVWDSMRRGAAFNLLVFPDPADIARDTAYFMTTWTPAQQVFPGVLEALGLDLGQAITVVVTACSFIGLWGWYVLARKLGFSMRTATAYVAIIAVNRHFTLPFGIYTGGEVPLFAAAPWFFLLVWTLRDLRWSAVLPLVAASLGLVFLKLSGIVLAGAAISAAVLCGDRPWLSRDTMRKAAVAGITLGLAAAIFYVAWYSRGWTAISDANHTDWSKLALYIAFTIQALWSGMFSFGDLLDYVFFFPSRPILTSYDILYYAMLLPAVASFAYAGWRLRVSHPAYLRFALLVAAALAGFFILTWLRGSAVSFHERHFRPVSLLLLVGVVEAFLSARNVVVRAMFIAVAGLAGLYGVASYGNHVRANLAHAVGARGFAYTIAGKPLLDHLRTVDVVGDDGSRPVVYVPSPEIALELRHSRIIATHADFEGEELLRSRVYRGRVPRIYVALQASLVANGKASIILRSFVDYPPEGWTATPLGGFVVYSARG